MERNYSQIARNTAFLYIRMLLIMAVTLYTSRIILNALGVTDFGIYNVVGGLSSFFIFFSSAFTLATQRFLNVELGRNDLIATNNVFCLSLLIHTILAVIVIIVGGLAGTWYVNNKLVLPFEQIPAARIVLYSMLATLALTFVGSVYESVIIARENMKLYAYLGLFDAFAKLGVSLAIQAFADSRLISYALLLASVKIISTVILIVYCRTHYIESIYRQYWDKGLFKQLISFISWNVYGTGVIAANFQGINLLLNWFFGPAINAANAIALQVNTAASNFCANFYTAVRPQIIKSYAIHDHDYFRYLIFSSSKIAIYLMWLIVMPLMLNAPYILRLWLKEVPDTTVEFVRFALVYALVNTFSNPLLSATQATGRLTKPIFFGSTIFLLALPVSWILLSRGAAPESIYAALVIFRIFFVAIIYYFLCKSIDNMTFGQYFYHVIIPCVLVIGITGLPMVFINFLLRTDSFVSLLYTTAIGFIFSTIVILFVGLKREERKKLISKAKYVLTKNNN